MTSLTFLRAYKFVMSVHFIISLRQNSPKSVHQQYQARDWQRKEYNTNRIRDCNVFKCTAAK